MKNEMLEYWKYIKEVEEALIKSGEIHLKIFEKGISLHKIFEESEVKEMLGNIEQLEISRDEAILSISEAKKGLLFANTQIKFTNALYNLSMKTIDQSQSN